jgi:4-aminobutyrate aminotransferase-like enzyme
VGVAGECIKIAPALDISREALEDGIQTLGEAMDEVLFPDRAPKASSSRRET